MIDVVGEGLRAVGTRSALAYPLVFAAGAVTGLGPCAAPRYVALAALTHAARRPWSVVAAFTTGLVGAYVALGIGAGAIAALWSVSSAVYAALAAALAAGGVVMLLRGNHSGHEQERCATGGGCRASAGDRRASVGGAFLLGASGALVISPCCVPVLAGIAALTVATGRTVAGVALLAAFACGHVVPVLAAATIGARCSALLARVANAEAPAVVAGGLMLSLSAYYGALA